MIPEKHLITKRFNQRAFTYHHVSPAQAKMARDLIAFLPESMSPKTILEIGCGTGHLTRLLHDHFPDAHITATDVAEMMLEVAAEITPDNPQLEWLQCDAEILAAHPHEPPPDFIVGNAVLQWLTDPVGIVRQFAAQLPPGGCAAFATLGPDTFRELQELLTARGISHPLGKLPDEATWRHQLNDFSAIIHSDEVIESAPDSRRFLKDISRSGAALPTARLDPSDLRRLLSEYDARTTTKGVPATWQRIFIIIRSPA